MTMFHKAFLTAMVLSGGVLTAAIPATQAVAAEPFTYRDMVKLDRVGALNVDPTGRYAVFQVTVTDLDANKRSTGLWLKDLNDPSKPEVKLAVSEGGASSPRFGPDGTIYFVKAANGLSQVFRTDLKGETAVQVTSLALDVGGYQILPNGKGLIVAAAVYPDCAGDEIACTVERNTAKKDVKATGVIYDKLFVRHWDTWADGTRNHLFYLPFNAEGVATSTVALTKGFDGDVPSKPFGDEGEFTISPDSKTVYISAREAGKTEPWSTDFDIYAISLDNPSLKILTPENPAWDGNPRVSPDGKTLAFKAMSRPGFEADRFGLYLMDIATGKVRPVAANWDRSVDALEWSRDGKALLVSADDIGKHLLFRIDIKTNKVTPLTKSGHIDAFEETSKGFVFLKSGLNSPSALFKAAPRAASIDEGAQNLTGFNAVLKERTFGEYEQFSFKGWNNETVYGYVIKPANYEAGKKYPVAFIVHGGPQGTFSDLWSFRWNAQTYAGEGYAVVMIDFHGSTGYGQAFTDSITEHWGDRPLEDLQKGWAHALSAYSYLDADRACALGASYGGYMINWMAGKWKEPWKCLVSHAGIFDVRTMAYETEELWFSEWENGGVAYDITAQLDKFNPAMHAKNWSVPMLIIHGDRDYRVVPGQGIAAFTALQRQGVKSKFLRFPDENHWILKPQNSVLWHATVFDWMKEHTK